MSERSNQAAWLVVPEEKYKVDLDLLTKYQAFSSELLRLSLLGLSIFGVMLSAGVLGTQKAKFWLTASIITFGLSTGLALAHRFYSTEGFMYHVLAIRKGDPQYAKRRNRIYKLSGIFLGGASVALGLGAVSLALGFTIAAL